MPRVSEEVKKFNESISMHSFDRTQWVAQQVQKKKQLDTLDIRQICRSIREQVILVERKRQYQLDTKKDLSKEETHETIIAKDRNDMKGLLTKEQIEEIYKAVEEDFGASSSSSGRVLEHLGMGESSKQVGTVRSMSEIDLIISSRHDGLCFDPTV